jgi:hypothetical protein
MLLDIRAACAIRARACTTTAPSAEALWAHTG